MIPVSSSPIAADNSNFVPSRRIFYAFLGGRSLVVVDEKKAGAVSPDLFDVYDGGR